mmetsp:Transcript_23498/g.67126  ORF Transcript_23498/g.67126 Transcript_23498/m.67126 type:complete len:254 (-) Transcript_23498:408-1169(-)
MATRHLQLSKGLQALLRLPRRHHAADVIGGLGVISAGPDRKAEHGLHLLRLHDLQQRPRIGDHLDLAARGRGQGLQNKVGDEAEDSGGIDEVALPEMLRVVGHANGEEGRGACQHDRPRGELQSRHASKVEDLDVLRKRQLRSPRPGGACGEAGPLQADVLQLETLLHPAHVKEPQSFLVKLVECGSDTAQVGVQQGAPILGQANTVARPISSHPGHELASQVTMHKRAKGVDSVLVAPLCGHSEHLSGPLHV